MHRYTLKMNSVTVLSFLSFQEVLEIVDICPYLKALLSLLKGVFFLVLVCFHCLSSLNNRIMLHMEHGLICVTNTFQLRGKFHVYLDNFKWVSCTSMLSMTGGREDSSEDTSLNSFWTLIKPRSATKALFEVEDSGTTITGAFKLTSIKRRKLFLAKSFMLEAAISAAWTVTAVRASCAVWKLFRKFYC